MNTSFSIPEDERDLFQIITLCNTLESYSKTSAMETSVIPAEPQKSPTVKDTLSCKRNIGTAIN